MARYSEKSSPLGIGYGVLITDTVFEFGCITPAVPRLTSCMSGTPLGTGVCISPFFQEDVLDTSLSSYTHIHSPGNPVGSAFRVFESDRIMLFPLLATFILATVWPGLLQ